jgi:hypothetical protein
VAGGHKILSFARGEDITSSSSQERRTKLPDSHGREDIIS